MEKKNVVIEAIRTRRSIRKFDKRPITDDEINLILESARWAPSGMNNQPWKFAIIRDPSLKESLSTLTHYGSVIQEAPVCIGVFLDHTRSYDRTKDVQAIGASIQNMLLTIHSLGLGGVWLGEILKNKEKVAELLGAGKELELMAVIAFGHPKEEMKGLGEREHLGMRDPLGKKVFFNQ
jgi:nitroreductase